MKHGNAKEDMRVLYQILEDCFPEDRIRIYRTGTHKQTLLISSIYTAVSDIIFCLKCNKTYLEEQDVYWRIRRINETTFN